MMSIKKSSQVKCKRRPTLGIILAEIHSHVENVEFRCFGTAHAHAALGQDVLELNDLAVPDVLSDLAVGLQFVILGLMGHLLFQAVYLLLILLRIKLWRAVQKRRVSPQQVLRKKILDDIRWPSQAWP